MGDFNVKAIPPQGRYFTWSVIILLEARNFALKI